MGPEGLVVFTCSPWDSLLSDRQDCLNTLFCYAVIIPTLDSNELIGTKYKESPLFLLVIPSGSYVDYGDNIVSNGYEDCPVVTSSKLMPNFTL